MIQSHTIKYENNEEILYLYLDFSNEFAKELGDKNKSIFSNIKKYLKTLKDDFKGTKVVIVASGIVLATLTLNTGLMRQNAVARNDNNLYITSVHFNEPSVVVKDDNVEETVETKKVETVKPEVKTSQTNTNKQTTTKTTSQKSTSNKTTSTNSNTTKSTTKQETKSTTKTTTKTTNQTTKQSTNQTTLKNPITIYRSNGDILKLEFEDYIIGVVAAEMPASFNTEALQAQAVLARTYALKTVKQGKKLTDTVATQVYKDNNQLKKLWGSEYSKYYNINL